MDNTINNFVENLIKDKGLAGLEPNILDQMKLDLIERVENRVNAVILENMPPTELEKFEQLLDESATDEQIQSFCREKILNLDSVLSTALLEFRTTYLG